MKLAVDVHYDDGGALVAAVAFDDWGAFEATKTYTTRILQVEKAPRGELDLRALPFLLQLLGEHGLQPEAIVLDDFVYLDAQETPGLGHHLHVALGGRTIVIGASRTAMAETPAQFEVHREEEMRPLVVTSAGLELGAAKARVRSMHGKRRIPTLMKLAARIAKGNGP